MLCQWATRIFSSTVESQNGWGWQRSLGSPGPIPAQAGTARAGCPGTYPGGFWKLPRRRLHSLWETWVSALPFAQHRSASLYLDRSSCVPVCACYLLGHPWASLKKNPGSILCTSLQVFLDTDEILAVLRRGKESLPYTYNALSNTAQDAISFPRAQLGVH